MANNSVITNAAGDSTANIIAFPTDRVRVPAEYADYVDLMVKLSLLGRTHTAERWDRAAAQAATEDDRQGFVFVAAALRRRGHTEANMERMA